MFLCDLQLPLSHLWILTMHPLSCTAMKPQSLIISPESQTRDLSNVSSLLEDNYDNPLVAVE